MQIRFIRGPECDKYISPPHDDPTNGSGYQSIDSDNNATPPPIAIVSMAVRLPGGV